MMVTLFGHNKMGINSSTVLDRFRADSTVAMNNSGSRVAESDPERRFEEEIEDPALQAEYVQGKNKKPMDNDLFILYDRQSVLAANDATIPQCEELLNPRSSDDTLVLYDREWSKGTSHSVSASAIRRNSTDESATEVHHGIVTGEPVQETAVSTGSSNSTDDEDEEQRIKNLLHMKFRMAKEALASGDNKKATEDLDVAVHFVEDLLNSPDLTWSVVQDIQDLLVVTFKRQFTEARVALHRNELQFAADLASAADKTFRVYDLHFPHLLSTHEYVELEEKAHALKKIQLEIAEKQDNILETVKCLFHLVLYGIDPSSRTKLVGLLETMIRRRNVLPKYKSDLQELVIWLEKQGKDLLKSNRLLCFCFCNEAHAIMKCCPDLPDKSKMDQVMCSVCSMLSFHLFSDNSVDPNPDRLDRIISYSKEALKDHSSYDYKPAFFYWTLALRGQRKFKLALMKALEYRGIKRKPGMTEAENKLLNVMDKNMQSLISELEEEVESLTHVEKSEDADPDWIDLAYHQTGPKEEKEKALSMKSKHINRRRKTFRRHSESSELGESRVQSMVQDNLRASATNHIPGQKKKGDNKEKTLPGVSVTSISSVIKNIQEAVSEGSHSISTSSLLPKLGKKTDKKKEDANSLENIFPEDSFYKKSVQILNETKNNFVSDLLQDQEVLIHADDPTHTNSTYQKKTPIYLKISTRELQGLLHSNPKDHKICTMSIYSSQKAHCTLLDPEDDLEVIEINGRTRCGQAFSKDVVVVKLLGDQTRNDATNGEVLGVLHKHSSAKHPVFICQADSNCPDQLMKPQCKTVAKVRVRRQRSARKPPPSDGNPAKFDIAIYDIRNEHVEFKCWKSFLRSDCNRFLFWVAYLDWHDNDLFPIGIVLRVTDLQAATEVQRMDMLMSAATVQHGLRVLYDRETLERTRQILDKTPTDVCKCQQMMEGRTNLTDELQVFTIDPVGSKDLDDALSLEVNPDSTLSVGVHIADVSAFVKKDDPIDKEAFSRLTSHYPPGKVPIHMIPDPLITDFLSLAEGKNRLALSLIFTFSTDGSCVKGRDCKILKTVVKSRKKYTYQEVQGIINTHRGSTDIATLEGKIMKLLQIAMKLRKERLGNGWYHKTLDWLDDDLSSWEAHRLVEELMILANKEVASFLLKRFPDCTPLRCQISPFDKQIEKFQSQFSHELTDIMSYLQQFIYFGKQNKDAGDGESANAGIRREISHIPVQKFVWQLLSAAIEAKDSKRIASIMHLENLHPSHALAIYEWIAIQIPAEFRCSSDSDDLRNLRHFSLGNVLYAQFTSPMRRYLDLVLHRLVHNALSDAVVGYRPDEIRMICKSVNKMQSVAKSYEKYCKSVKLAIKLQKEPLNVAGIIVSVTEEKVELLNPFAQQRIEKVFDLNFSKLGVYSQPELHKPDDPSEGVTLTWKKRLYDARGTHPHAKPAVKPNMKKGIGRQVSKLDPMYNISLISLDDWKKLEDFVTKPKMKLGTMDPKPPADGTVSDVTSEVRDGELWEQHCSFSLSLKRGQCISVQLSAKQTSGLYQPEVQLCTIAPSVTLCVLHMDDPVQMFTRMATRAAQDKYQTVEQYKKIWIPILNMEIAANIISDPEETVVINNQKVALTKPIECKTASGNSYTGNFCLPWTFCNSRSILDHSEENSGLVTDYLCLRYTPSAASLHEARNSLPVGQTIKQILGAQTTWIGHGQVNNVVSQKTTHDYQLAFKLNHICQQPPEELFSKTGVPCTIELLHKGPGDRRIEEALLGLKDGTLAASVAKGYKATSPSKELLQIISKMKPWMVQKSRELDKYGLDLSMWEVKSKDGTGFPGNNRSQREAIEKAIKSDFSIIHGPPGTGKTFTAIKLVYFFVLINKFTQMDLNESETRQVLFCGPSNKSVDVVAKYLKRKFGANCPRIVRVYGETIESKEYPKPTKWISPRLASCRAVCDPDLKEIALHHLIRRPRASYANKIKQYDNLIKSSPDEAWKKRKEISKLLFTAGVEELKGCEVVLCTATSSSSKRIVEGTNVFQCIVDECAMCPEPECLVPLVSSMAKQVVLIGDHKQLQPIIICKDAVRLGLQKSLFERYAEVLEKAGTATNYTMLNIQYRMHPSICDFPSKVFYDDKLVTGSSSSWEGIGLPIWPGKHAQYKITDGGTVQCQARVVFCHVEGKEETLQVSTEEGNENSKSNRIECNHVVRIVDALVQQQYVEPKHINVMSQYNAQCTLLKQRLNHHGELNVNTVVTSQGGEWDYVVFSMVRSLPKYLIDPHPTMGWNQENLGFITDVHQINVALTRAKKGLIIIGNKNLLKCDRVWERLLNKYDQLGALIEVKDFPPQSALGRQISQPAGAAAAPRRQNSQPGGVLPRPLQPLWTNTSSSAPYRL